MTAGLRREEIAQMKESNVTIEVLDLTPAQALGVALSVAAPTMLMEDAQKAAPAMLAHIEAMGFRITNVGIDSQDTATARIAALDAEIARREAPDYQWFPKPNANQTPSGRAGAAAARAMQHGELTGLKIARAVLWETVK